MARTLMVQYDLMSPGQKYDKLIEFVKTHDGWAKVLQSTWLIVTDKSVKTVRDQTLGIIDTNDKVLVTDVTNAPMAWYGLTDEIGTWIQGRYRKAAV
ncbi:hypothetical protein [Patulibacter sp.]|uniref:hypothetical protein n=1 Tax=Patulibacter sp. TaxID=1912859 RepID=UPI002725C8F8|nr:hypothetical protein [Patulibacter sp.]MDO9409698.1 hypothetical protein [Patulibacter sp.]